VLPRSESNETAHVTLHGSQAAGHAGANQVGQQATLRSAAAREEAPVHREVVHLTAADLERVQGGLGGLLRLDGIQGESKDFHHKDEIVP
jgi:hypothetical protein